MKKQSVVVLIIVVITLSLCGCTGPEKNSGDNNPLPGGGGNNEDFQLPSLTNLAPLPEPPVTGEEKTIVLGNLEFTYYDAIFSDGIFSLGADILIHVKNNGTATDTFYTQRDLDMRAAYQIPNWVMHFFAYQTATITLQPSEEKTLHYFSSNDGSGEFTVNFEFWQQTDQSDKIIAPINITSLTESHTFETTSAIYGYVLDKTTQQPIGNAEVIVNFYNGRETAARETTDAQGRYVASTPSIDDITAYFGGQEITYQSLGFFVTVQKDGYEYYYQDEVSPERGEQLRLDINLTPKETTETYTLDWENNVSDYYGFFWLKIDDDWNYVAASQAKHIPELNKATHFYFFDAKTGEQKWSFPTENECWGFDINQDGTLVAAGCSDGYVYVVNTNDGSLHWKKDSGGMNRFVEFSHDGTLLLTGPAPSGTNTAYDFVLYNVSDGSIVRGFSGYNNWLRNGRFTDDDSKFVVGLSGGYVAMFDTTSGERLWENYVGEFPLFLAIDNQDNTYACGKGRTLFSFDKDGDLRWSYRVPDHTTTAGMITPDGSHVVIGTVGAWVYDFNGATGEVRWRQRITGENVCHNAVSVSSGGGYVAIGSGPDNVLTIFNTKGTKIFEHTSTLNPDPILDEKWATIGPTASAGTQKGIMCTVISSDGSTVIAGYGDDYIRSFTKQ
jgi:outer membrane protein assembly factor BamB